MKIEFKNQFDRIYGFENRYCHLNRKSLPKHLEIEILTIERNRASNERSVGRCSRLVHVHETRCSVRQFNCFKNC